jgi:Spy/CpxP family protein refolding chaperone
MRNSYLTAGFLSMALAMSLPAVAQSSTTNTPEHRPPEAPSQATPSQAAPGQAGATSEAAPGHAQPQAQAADDNPLNLTDEQKAKLQPILQDENRQMEALRNDTSMTQEQKIAKANEVRQNASPKIKAILTPEQLQKLADLQQKARQQQQQQPSTPTQAAPPPHQ